MSEWKRLTIEEYVDRLLADGWTETEIVEKLSDRRLALFTRSRESKAYCSHACRCST